MKYTNDPSDFDTPKKSHNVYIPTMNQNSETQVIDKTNDKQINHNTESLLENYNTSDNEMLDNIFDNIEK